MLPFSSISIAAMNVGPTLPPIDLGNVVLKQGELGMIAYPLPAYDV